MEDVDILDVEFEFQHHFNDEYGEFCKTVKTTIRDCIDNFEKELISIGLKNNFISASWIKDKYFYYTESKENHLEIFNQELEKLKIILPNLGIQHLRLLIDNAINSALLKNFSHFILDINNAFLSRRMTQLLIEKNIPFIHLHQIYVEKTNSLKKGLRPKTKKMKP